MPKILSSEASKNVGRPGFGGWIPGPRNTKAAIRRLMVRDPAKGISSPAADKITSSHVDIVSVRGTETGLRRVAKSFGSGRRTVHRAPKSPPKKR